MTRFLSHALQAEEPFFRLGLRKLEEANGHPAADIRFTTEVIHGVKRKVMELDLDPHDTTPKELYRALEQRMSQDDRRLTRRLQTAAAIHLSAEADVVAGMVHVLKELPDSKHCFALKPSSLKMLIKKQPPKKAMKQLGYRSLDSFIKHESPALILAAGWLAEGETWRRRLLEQYTRLKSSDFEHRNIIIIRPHSDRWREFAQKMVDASRHNLLCFKEFGALVFLPLPAHAPVGIATASLSLALHELNEIRAASTYLQLQQVQADFGKSVAKIATEEPKLHSELFDQPVSWNLIQRYYSRLKHHFNEEIFEPYLQLESMVWHSAEETLAKIEPSFEFWRNTAHLGLLDGRHPVSLNLADVALNFCNKLAYEHRAVHYLQQDMRHELMLRYLKHGSVEASVLAELQPKLAQETVLA